MDDQRLSRIETKLDKASDHLSSIDVTLAAQHESLKQHIKRTDELQTIVLPIQKHVILVNGVFKIAIASVAAISLILKLLGKI